MDDAALVGGGQGGADAAKEGKALVQGERSAGEPLRQIFAVEPLHRQEAVPVRRLAVIDVGDDAGVAQLGQELGLAAEAVGLIGAAAGAVEQLERHTVAALPIVGAVYGSHAAAAGQLLDHKAVGKEAPWSQLYRDHRD